MFCSQCGEKNLEHARFCFNCGYDLNEVIKRYKQLKEKKPPLGTETGPVLEETVTPQAPPSQMAENKHAVRVDLLGSWEIPTPEIPLPAHRDR